MTPKIRHWGPSVFTAPGQAPYCPAVLEAKEALTSLCDSQSHSTKSKQCTQKFGTMHRKNQSELHRLWVISAVTDVLKSVQYHFIKMQLVKMVGAMLTIMNRFPFIFEITIIKQIQDIFHKPSKQSLQKYISKYRNITSYTVVLNNMLSSLLFSFIPKLLPGSFCGFLLVPIYCQPLITKQT